MDYLQYTKDINGIKNHKSFEDLQKNDPELYARFLEYNKNNMFPGAEALALMRGEGFENTKIINQVTDSLKKAWEKPAETPPQKPVERSALETISQAIYPRMTERGREGKEGIGGDLVASALDAATLIPRTVSTIQQAPIDVMNYFVGDKTSEQVPFSTIGETGGKSFQMPNLPAWAPDIVKDAYGVVRPVAEGVGEFGTSVARGPIIPGGSLASGVRSAGSTFLGKPLAYLASKPSTVGDVVRFGGEVAGDVAKASPQALKTALGFIDNLGTGAALGTSESIARGEGIDPFGTSLGAVLGGTLPYIGKVGTYFSDKKTGNILLDAQHDIINKALSNKNLATAEYNLAIKQKADPKDIQRLKDIKIKADAEYDKLYKASPGKKSRQEWEKSPEELSKFYTNSLNKKAEKLGYAGDKPTSLMDALEKYSPIRNPILPEDQIYNAIPSLQTARSRSSDAASELGRRAAAGKLGALFQLQDLLKGESYLPEKIINPVVRDATLVTPQVIRGGNTLRDYLTNPQVDQRKY